MSQTEIIFALIKKTQIARKEYFDGLDRKKTQTILSGEVRRLELEFSDWSIALEKLSIILSENANEITEYERARSKRVGKP